MVIVLSVWLDMLLMGVFVNLRIRIVWRIMGRVNVPGVLMGIMRVFLGSVWRIRLIVPELMLMVNVYNV